MKPELVYPEAQCYDCGAQILETEFFGRFKIFAPDIFCAPCYVAAKGASAECYLRCEACHGSISPKFVESQPKTRVCENCATVNKTA